jgi:hypothetical protein
MSLRSTLLAGLATLTLVGGTLAGVSTVPASAQTTRPAASSACGSGCTTISAEEFGSGWVLEVLGSAKVGAGLYLVPAANSENEDFRLSYAGTVEQFYDAGLFNSVVGTTWPNDDVYQYEYAPGGTDSGLCVGATSVQEPLTLQDCGVSAVTCWVALANDDLGGYEPLMTATDTVVNAPYVMEAPAEESDFDTMPLSLYQGTFSPYEMLRDLNGVL